jgi:hypothetical protein
MTVYRFFLPFWFKVWTLPILLWLLVAGTYLRQDYQIELQIMRSFFLPYAILATGLCGVIVLVWSFRHAK